LESFFRVVVRRRCEFGNLSASGTSRNPPKHFEPDYAVRRVIFNEHEELLIAECLASANPAPPRDEIIDMLMTFGRL
jgi:hypothetical protein